MNDRNARSTVASNYHFDNGRDHWRNPLWLIPLIHETPIRGLQTRPANRECRHPHQTAAEAVICWALCFWLRSSFSVISFTGMAAEPTAPPHPRRHRQRRASPQHRLQPRQHKIKYRKRPARAGLFTITEMAANHIWIGLAKVARADSRTASDMVGWAWQVRAKSSDEPPNSISTASSWIISPAL